LDKRTRAYLRRAELGFLGVIVPTRVQTPRFWEDGWFTVVFASEFHRFPKAGVFDL
jgi:hypothetical protein